MRTKHFFLTILFFFVSVSCFSLPVVKTGNSEIDEMADMAVKEAEMNITKNGVFSAGANWPTAWTRDMSYAIDLSLGMIFPETVEKSLASRVEDNLILQDTGSGGSWPVSSDRIVWAIAAYEYALTKQDPSYFEWIYDVIEKTLEQDFYVTLDTKRNLFKGETTFIDWRENSYPRWVDPVFIANSYALGTNNLFLSAFNIEANLAQILNKPQEKISLWQSRVQLLKEEIKNHFWIKERGYFADYILNNIFDYRYEGYETLGNALSVLNSVNNEEISSFEKESILSGKYGMPVFAPQLSNVKPYHNNGVWPFVQAYYALACRKLNKPYLVQNEFKTMMAAAKKFKTFKENYVATDFSPDTQTNSDRQLWSDAGFLAYFYKILFGIQYTTEGLSINPYIFMDFGSPVVLQNFDFLQHKINITVTGKGDKITSYLVNGIEVSPDYVIPYSSNENLNIFLKMEESETFVKNSKAPEKRSDSYEATDFSPIIPIVSLEAEGSSQLLEWRQKNPKGFVVLKNFKPFKKTNEREFKIKPSSKLEIYSVISPSESENIPLLPGTPVRCESTKNTTLIEAEKCFIKGGTLYQESAVTESTAKLSYQLEQTVSNFNSYVKNWGSEIDDEICFKFTAKKAGMYAVDFRFQNGHGPVNTGEKCAVSALYVNGEREASIPLPQLGNWTSWNFSAPVLVYFEKGDNSISLKIDQHCYTQRNRLNPVNIDLCRISKIE